MINNDDCFKNGITWNTFRAFDPWINYKVIIYTPCESWDYILNLTRGFHQNNVRFMKYFKIVNRKIEC